MDKEFIESLKKPEFDPIVKELWDNYKKLVKEHGRSKESKELLIKIHSLAPKE
ncbi:hypothetical protein [Paenibacillus tianjinensis]|uniref:Uncharacterized protein n=1 Tax=Paenibacillus tianjinensis TaxID=2810347 RepID=A0ABX7L5D5_9BACL|nr:hypothetical protein [Paenibacillus tianjinensis]QSF43290.1 hypothetical protein JRJ22_18660 [Paenibacillus tianjinensis]